MTRARITRLQIEPAATEMVDGKQQAVQHAAVQPSAASIPWDKTVEFFHSGPDLQVARVHMLLRDAVEHFLGLPPEEQDRCGIGLHEAMIRMMDGQPTALGFLRPNAIRMLAERL